MQESFHGLDSTDASFSDLRGQTSYKRSEGHVPGSLRHPSRNGNRGNDSPGKHTMSDHERFNVVYDGPALADHRMDVRDLAPALIALADLFSAANKALNADAADVRIEVKGSFRAGSFNIELIFVQQFLAQLRDMFAGASATAIANGWTILGLLGCVGGGGVIGLLRRLRGRRPHRIEPLEESVRIWVSESESFEVEDRVVRLWRNQSVRVSLQKTLSPLEREGITSFGIVRGEQIELKIDDTDLPDFAASISEGEVVTDAIVRKVLQIESAVFKDGNKWRVHDGQYPFFASLDDAAFLAKINAGERFGKGDVLVVELRQVQTVEAGTLKTDNHIVKVLEHRAPLQQNLL
ncbi:hypothetical protein [Paraburkholderia sp.]|uniref:hypothetical protein n=1 Tax=Paraburkholderia sp. TaxID=1926495 RepID=UPI00286F46F7|nr:hypothetical protein [Paraburkholderia sp.]